ncbi:hypothetical protein FB561_7428 [Kribbella amoyensis]|uniref:WD40 repeat protein n=1 Tax=Kribbella amoyensis TaxID=996641 RepID=A0A561B0Q7_9ACTN|nr:hypothetical protein [Kribbella amoyensis]TWD72436.1 hypothetical protein FB561_7428 [Kribbella amoyensis]
MKVDEVRPLLERVTEDLPEPELTDAAWANGRGLHRRQVRGTALLALLVALAIVAIGLLASSGGRLRFVPPDTPPTHPPGYVAPTGQIAGIDFWTAPPSGSERFLDRLETPLGDLLRLPDHPDELTTEPIDRIAAVVLARREGGYEPLLLAPNGLWARTDMLLAPITTGSPLSAGAVSPNGRMAAFPQPGHVAVIDATTAEVRRLPLPVQDIRSVSWTPDSEHLLAGAPTTTYRVLVGHGDEPFTVVEPTRDPDSATAPYRLDGTEGQVAVRRFTAGGWIVETMPDLPVSQWNGQTFTGDDVMARLFVARHLVQVRTVASVPQIVAAMSTVQREPSRLLVLGETPAATPAPVPEPSPPDAIRTLGCCSVLGWYDGDTVLFQVTGWVLAWDLPTGQVRRVTELEVPGLAIGAGIRG